MVGLVGTVLGVVGVIARVFYRVAWLQGVGLVSGCWPGCRVFYRVAWLQGVVLVAGCWGSWPGFRVLACFRVLG